MRRPLDNAAVFNTENRYIFHAMNRQSNQQYRTSPSCCPLVSHRQHTRPIRVAYARPLCANMTSSTNRKCIAYCIVVLSVPKPAVQYVLVLSGRIVMHGIRCDLLLIHPRRGLMVYVLLLFLVISVRPIISTSSGPICRIGRPLAVFEQSEVIFFDP